MNETLFLPAGDSAVTGSEAAGIAGISTACEAVGASEAACGAAGTVGCRESEGAGAEAVALSAALGVSASAKAGPETKSNGNAAKRKTNVCFIKHSRGKRLLGAFYGLTGKRSVCQDRRGVGAGRSRMTYKERVDLVYEAI